MAYVQSVSNDAGGSGTGTTQAFSVANTAGNTLIFGVRCGGDCVVTVTDSKGNTWTENVHQVQSSDLGMMSVWSAPNCAAGANTVTFSFSTAVTARWFIAEYSGMLTSNVFDVKTATDSGASTSTTPTSGSATPTTGKSLVLGIVVTGGSQGVITAGSGFTLREAANATYRIALEDKEITSTSAQTASFNFTGADTTVTAVVIYKEVLPNASVVQETSSLNAATSTTAAASLSGTAAGNTLHVGVVINSGSTISSVADTQGNTYFLLSSFNDTTSGRRYAQYCAPNIIGGVGANTVTATFNVTNTSGGIVIREIGNVKASPVDNNQTTNQQSPGTGSDGVTQSLTNTAQPALISSFCFANSATAPTAGTGQTSGITGSQGNVSFRTQSKRVVVATSQVSTFTAGVNVAHTQLTTIFDEIGSSSAIDALFFLRRTVIVDESPLFIN